MDKNSFNEFINVFFSNEIILILLVVLVIVLIILIVYLVKLEKKERIKILDTSLLENENKSNQPEEITNLENENDNDPFGLFDTIMPSNDEESAIISTDELAKASKDLSASLGMDNSEIIDMYEEEQEKKAIISYEELLKNAASLNIKYEEPTSKEMDIPIIKKIEVNENNGYVKANIESTNKIMDYVEEEEFLKVLKNFRMDLET